jgi:cytochrome c
MKKAIVMVASFAVGTAAAGFVLASEDLAKKSGCMGCHDVAAKKMGPSFKDVAAKNKGKADAEGKIVAELKAGKKHPAVKASDADLTTLVKWVLSQ